MEKHRESISSIEEVDTSHSDNEASIEMADGEVESDVEVNTAPTSKRQRKLPAKFRDSAFLTEKSSAGLDLEAEMRDKKVCVKCNQTGKLFKVKVTALARSDEEEMTMDDLVRGSQLLLTLNKKSYPVTVQKVVSALTDSATEQNRKADTKNPRKRDGVPTKSDPKAKRVKRTLDKENLNAAKSELTQVQVRKVTHPVLPVQMDEGTPQSSSSSDRALLLEIRDMLGSVLQYVKGLGAQGGGASCKKELQEDEAYIVNGVSLMRIPSKDACAYGRALLDHLFTKEEQKSSIVLKSKKSLKPPLSPKRVEKMFDCIQRRYGSTYDHTELLKSLNQKCRDAKPGS